MESTREIWQKALGELQTQISRANYNTWLRDSYGVSSDDGTFVVATPNAFVAEWLTKRLHSLVRKTLTSVIGSETDVQFVVREAAPAPRRPQLKSALADGAAVAPPPIEVGNGCRFTFDNFVVGSCNRLAFATAVEAAENPLNSFNPLYIYGGTGQGKTHLLQAIAHSGKLRNREVLYLTAERFTDEFVMAVKQKRVEGFHDRFRSLSLLLFDDIQFLATKRQTQQCFYHIFDELHQRGCQIAIAGDHHPREIPLLGEKLRSRLESGMVACIQAPDLDSRIAFLEAKAAESDIVLPPDAVKLLAEEVRGNMRQLEGAIVYLSAQSRLTGEPINSQSVNRLLTSVFSSGEGRTIIHAVAEVFDVPVEDLIGKKRDRKTSLARHAAMYLMRKVTACSFSDIGRELGNRNHATVLHGYNKILDEIATNPRLERQLARIMEQISSSQTQ
ncbi:MAG: chromosomal replication initiator protein DnaA [Dehalococcoidia bacterium]|nr:chromosomal replication initiator protein DnaA [Dehalococcoidia bacterium]